MIKELILASKSPQRKRILKKLGIRFKAVPSNINENFGSLKRPHAIVKKIALDKAMKVAEKYNDKWILGCDTFVVLSDGSISLKPKNKKQAKQTLLKYKNSYCDVYSGLVMVNLKLDKKLISYEKTRLHFKNFSNKELEEYLNSNEWKNSSGSMTIEGKGGRWINKIEGDYWNVVGLPINLLKKWLELIFSSRESKGK